jgi:hypothetical protein
MSVAFIDLTVSLPLEDCQMAYAPPWLELAYKLAQNPSSTESRIAAELPELLTNGVSVLEVSRRLRASPDVVAPFLEQLEEAGVTRRETSSSSALFPNDLFYLRSDGVGFFKQLSSLRASSASRF